jgi:hypothetical protein
MKSPVEELEEENSQISISAQKPEIEEKVKSPPREISPVEQVSKPSEIEEKVNKPANAPGMDFPEKKQSQI